VLSQTSARSCPSIHTHTHTQTHARACVLSMRPAAITMNPAT
jgi:hypothetical protein